VLRVPVVVKVIPGMVSSTPAEFRPKRPVDKLDEIRDMLPLDVSRIAPDVVVAPMTRLGAEIAPPTLPVVKLKGTSPVPMKEFWADA